MAFVELISYLLSFIGLLLVFQIIFFEVVRAKAVKENNYEWFNNFNQPYSYTRTGTMIFICFICYLFADHSGYSTAEWFIYLLIFIACGVIADAVTQFIVMKYAKIRCRKWVNMAGNLDHEFEDIKNQLTVDENYEVSLARYNETLIAKQYVKPEHHMSFLTVDHGNFASQFGTYPASTFDVEPYADKSEVMSNLSGTPVRAVGLTESGQMPFKDDRMDVIFDEYATFNQNEMKRILKPGGILILNQYGSDHLKEINEMFVPQILRGTWNVSSCRTSLESAGFQVLEAYEDYGYIRFRNIAQLHTYLKTVIPDAATHPENFKALYTKALGEIKNKNFFQLSTYRFLVVARKS
jgi:SAM-dependent methyltransferase